jgi:hypothetical protein
MFVMEMRCASFEEKTEFYILFRWASVSKGYFHLLYFHELRNLILYYLNLRLWHGYPPPPPRTPNNTEIY